VALYLVTGGAGFIGSHLLDRLIGQGHRVRVLDNLSSGRVENLPRGVDFRAGDVTEQTEVRRALESVDGCFHLAAISSVERGQREWLHAHSVNLTGTITVFEEARRVGQRLGRPLPVIYASSAAVYGNASEIPVSEDTPVRPISAYGVDKLGCELHAAAGSSLGVNTIGLRFFNVYGPRQDPDSPYSGVISIFCRRVLQGSPIEICGDGGQVRDFVYVDDAATALIRAMNSVGALPQVCNVCSGIGTTIYQLGETIAQIRGVPFAPKYAPSRLGDLRVSIGDPRQAHDKLGFSAETPLGEGLARTLEWMASREAAGADAPGQMALMIEN
jgi:UDP-glucose 4-epimerase